MTYNPVKNPSLSVSSNDLFSFIDGMRDCEQGKPHVDRSEYYTRGYNYQYQLEQLNSWRAQNVERCR